MSAIKQKLLIAACLASVLCAAGALTVSLTSGNTGSATRLAFVRSNVLIYEYQGMKDAHARLETLSNEWLGEIKQKEENLKGQQELIHKAADEGEVPQVLQRDAAAAYHEIEALKSEIAGEFQEKEQKLTQGALNQINDFVQEYGRREGYDLVLGTSNSGNVLYGVDAIDITDEVLKELNRVYTGNN